MNRALDNWFATEILPHEAALMRYLARVWKSPPDIPDLRQETYVRVYESAARKRPRAPRAFLFTTARNLMVDRIRREKVVSIEYSQDLDTLDVSIDELSPERRLSARQELQRLTEAFDGLPAMTRAVIWLRRVEGLSQREAAQSLGIEEGALEGHMSRGLRSLADTLFAKFTETGHEGHE
jgi:RNA polymerase sigma-70 factor (ECF subfamily)